MRAGSPRRSARARCGVSSLRSPTSPALMGPIVALGDGMRAHHDVQAVLGRQELAEGIDTGAGRIADHQTGRQVNYLSAVLLHFRRGVLDVPAGAATTCGEAHQRELLAFIDGERAFPVAHGPQALTSGASVVAVADDDA